MDVNPHSPHPDSGSSSPRSREVDAENAISWDETPPPIPIRVKLMCSYGGRIQPRHHDNQLSYIGGETKILAVDRSVRFPAFLLKITTLCGAASTDVICFKYQLPGEDLDSLISVTNDEDLEHMMNEYDRFHRSAAKCTTRLRLFVFPLKPVMRYASAFTMAEQQVERKCFKEELNSVPVQLVHHNSLQPPPLPPTTLFPDFLSCIMPHLAPIKLKNPTPEPIVVEPLPVDAPPGRSDFGNNDRQQIVGQTAVSSSTDQVQDQIPEIHLLQIAEDQHQLQPTMQGDGIVENLGRVYLGKYYSPSVQDKTSLATMQIPVALSNQRNIPSDRYTSVAGVDQKVHLITPPALHGVYPLAVEHGYYTSVPPAPPSAAAILPSLLPAKVYCQMPPMYTVAPPPPPAGGNVLVSQYPEGSTALRTAVGMDATTYSAAPVVYDSSGRAVFYSAAISTCQTVTSLALNSETT